MILFLLNAVQNKYEKRWKKGFEWKQNDFISIVCNTQVHFTFVLNVKTSFSLLSLLLLLLFFFLRLLSSLHILSYIEYKFSFWDVFILFTRFNWNKLCVYQQQAVVCYNIIFTAIQHWCKM